MPRTSKPHTSKSNTPKSNPPRFNISKHNPSNNHLSHSSPDSSYYPSPANYSPSPTDDLSQHHSPPGLLSAISAQTLSGLISSISRKKEFSSLPQSIILRTLQQVLISHPKLGSSINNPKFNNPKSASYRQLTKITRAALRRDYSLFRSFDSPTTILLRRLASTYVRRHSPSLLPKILSCHESTRERLPIYPQLYRELFSITGKPSRILDIGCGLNPFSLPYMGLELNTLTYHAYDISTTEIELIHSYFSSLRASSPAFHGHAAVHDVYPYLNIPPHTFPLTSKYPSAPLTHPPNLKYHSAHPPSRYTPPTIHPSTNSSVKAPYPFSDIAFCFKVLDIFDKNRGHKRSETLLELLPVRFIIASFATTTMSGRPMTAPRRSWLAWICRRRGWTYTILEFENEIFYIIKKTPEKPN